MSTVPFATVTEMPFLQRLDDQLSRLEGAQVAEAATSKTTDSVGSPDRTR
jgi:hypothetical protein